ncbi:RDD family protein [Microbacterium sp.]|uniref:RDD family protein n=1 Tax=Microbacterium sp. TaxID=51671 RepID=UPI003A8C9682
MTTIWEVDDADEEIEGLDAAGRPDPAYAAALGLIRAPYGRRFLAVTIDIVVYLIVQIPYWVFSVPLLLMFARSEITLYGLVAHPNFFVAVLIAGITALLTLALLIVQGAFQGRAGVTIGKAITGIRSINVVRLAKPGFWRIVLRTLIVGASNIVPVIGPTLMFCSALGDSEKRGRAWHDHATQVWLIDVKKGLDPYDGKRMRIARKVVKVEIAPQSRDLPSLATAESSAVEPEYRPAHSVSAGVLGIAKAKRAGRDDSVGIVAQHLGSASAVTAAEKEGGRVGGG